MRSCAAAYSSMILLARNSCRRCTSSTWLANLVRPIASSRAASPPPTTITRLPAKRAPSQTLQYAMPRP